MANLGQNETSQSPRLFGRELRFQSVIISLALAALVKIVTAITTLQTTMAETKVEIGHLQAQTATAYRADIAQRDIGEVNDKVANMQNQVNGLDGRLGNVERFLMPARHTAPLAKETP